MDTMTDDTETEAAPNADDIRAEVEAVDVGDYARDDDERTLFRYLRRRSQAVAEITHLKDQTSAMIRSLENQVKGLDYVYLPLAQDIASRKLAGGKLKSLKTPFGTVGFRTQKPGLVVVDEERCLGAITVTPGMEKCVAVRRVIVKAALNDYVTGTGEIPPGCEMGEGGEKFYVR